jgi:hypothetical protein
MIIQSLTGLLGNKQSAVAVSIFSTYHYIVYLSLYIS